MAHKFNRDTSLVEYLERLGLGEQLPDYLRSVIDVMASGRRIVIYQMPFGKRLLAQDVKRQYERRQRHGRRET
jgi:hypothetical protein